MFSVKKAIKDFSQELHDMAEEVSQGAEEASEEATKSAEEQFEESLGKKSSRLQQIMDGLVAAEAAVQVATASFKTLGAFRKDLKDGVFRDHIKATIKQNMAHLGRQAQNLANIVDEVTESERIWREMENFDYNLARMIDSYKKCKKPGSGNSKVVWM